MATYFKFIPSVIFICFGLQVYGQNLSVSNHCSDDGGYFTFTVDNLTFGDGGEVVFFECVSPNNLCLNFSSEIRVGFAWQSSVNKQLYIENTNYWRAAVIYDNSPTAILTNFEFITISPELYGGSLIPFSDHICIGGNKLLTLNNNTNTVIEHWQKSEESDWATNPFEEDVWTDIMTETDVNFNVSPTVPTKYRVKQSGQNCSGTQTIYSNEVTVNIDWPTAGQAVVSDGEDDFCDSGTANLHLTGTVSGTIKSWRYRYRTNGSLWSDEYTTTTSSRTFDLNVSSEGGTRIYEFWARVKSGVCSELSSAKEVVTVYTKPTLAVTPGTISFVESGSTNISMSNPNGVSGTTYSWTANATNVTGANSGSGSSIQQSLYNYGSKTGTVTYIIRANTSQCTSNTQTVTITVKAEPQLSANKSTICGAQIVRFTVSRLDGSAAGLIKFYKDNNFDSQIGFETVTAITHDINVTGDYTWHAIVEYDLENLKSNTKDIVFNPTPSSGSMNVYEESICQGASILLQITNHSGDIDEWEYSEVYDWGGNGEDTVWHPYAAAGNASSHLVTPNVDTKYRVKTSNETCGVPMETSESTILLELPTFSGAAEAVNNEDKFCDSGTANIALSGLTVGNILSWNHQYSDDAGTTWSTTDTDNSSISVFSFPVNTSSPIVRQYKVWAVLKNGACPEKISASEIIYVYPTPAVNAGADITLFNQNLSTQLAEGSPNGGIWSGEYIIAGGTFGLLPEGQELLGDYILTYTANQGFSECQASDDLTVHVLAVPEISNAGDNCLFPAETRVLSIESIYTTYQWYRNDETIVNGNTHTITIDKTGLYTVNVTTVDGFSELSNEIVIRSAFNCQDINYVETKNYTFPTVDEIYTSDLKTEVQQSTTYYDGLGRAMQTVATQSSATDQDIVQPIAYDQYGRQSIQYLPYVSNDSEGLYQPTALEILDDDDEPTYTGSPHQLFYADLSSKVATDTRPYSETIFEPSPLNRPSQQYGPGQAWRDEVNSDNDRPVRYRYEINATDEVLLWTISGDYPITTTNYTAGELYKNITIDEEKHQVIEFVDKLGRTILKRVQAVDSPSATPTASDWADTYYVYDDFGNLRFVLPPEAVNNLSQYDN